MKRGKIVVKRFAEMYFLFLGLNFASVIFAVSAILIYWEVPIEIFMDTWFEYSLDYMTTVTPYFVSFLCVCGWYVIKLINFLRFPSVKFTLNEFLTIRFTRGKTVIYVKDEPFNSCMYLLMNVPLSDINDFESIDQASEFYDKQLETEIKPKKVGLSPEEEFKGHCSNLQVWAENNYDTYLLHKNLAFPLLKRLSIVGDPVAKKVLVREITERFKSKATSVQIFLVQGRFLSFLEDETVKELFQYVVDKQVFYCLAGHFYSSQNLQLEIEALNLLVQADSINYTYNMILANRYAQNNDNRNARLVFRKLLTLYPNDEKSLFFLAHLYLFENKIPKAKKMFGRVKNSEFKFVKYKNVSELSDGMYKLLKLGRFDRNNDPFPRLRDETFEEW